MRSVLFTTFSIIFIVFFFYNISGGAGVQVFSLQTQVWAKPTMDVYLRLRLGPPGRKTPESVSALTICYRFRSVAVTQEEVHLSYALPESANTIYIYRDGATVVVLLNNTPLEGLEDNEAEFQMGVWSHYCLVLTLKEYFFYIDGSLKTTGSHSYKLKQLRLNGYLVLGQEQDEFGSGFVLREMFFGDLAQVNWWSRVLSKDEIEDIASCTSDLHGDIFSSDVDEMENFGVSVSSVPVLDLCKSDTEFLIYTNQLNLFEAAEFCDTSGGEIFSPASCDDEAMVLYNTSLTFANFCPNSFWVGVTDMAEEGTWRQFGSQKEATTCFNLPPNGRESENCASLRLENGLWDDRSCHNPDRCFSCKKEPLRPLRLRGYCFKTPERMLFEVLGYVNNNPYYHGYYGIIIYMTEAGYWQMINTRTNETLASLHLKTAQTYPVGRRSWKMKSTECDFHNDEYAELSLSACDSSEIVCSGGQCLPSSARCDGRYQCADMSDEDECQVVSFPSSYRRQLPPEALNGTTPPPLSITVSFLRFLSIEDTRYSVTAEFKVQTEWKDRRLQYRNLRPDSSANKVSMEQQDSLWRPGIKFTNILAGKVSILQQDIHVAKSGDPRPRHFNEVHMDTLYDGDAATLVETKHISGDFECHFYVYDYPFDSQRCSVAFLLPREVSEHMSVHEKHSKVNYGGSEFLPSYKVTDFTVDVSHDTQGTSLEISFLLVRRPRLLVIKLFIPSVMLLLVGYITLFIPRNLLQARLIVALTTKLVMYTLFNQTSSSLPITAYVKLVDIWFFFCISTLFFIIIFHVFSEYLPENSPNQVKALNARDDKTITERRVWLSADRAFKIVRYIVIPTGTLVFLIVYFCLMVAS